MSEGNIWTYYICSGSQPEQHRCEWSRVITLRRFFLPTCYVRKGCGTLPFPFTSTSHRQKEYTNPCISIQHSSYIADRSMLESFVEDNMSFQPHWLKLIFLLACVDLCLSQKNGKRKPFPSISLVICFFRNQIHVMIFFIALDNLLCRIPSI